MTSRMLYSISVGVDSFEPTYCVASYYTGNSIAFIKKMVLT